MNIKFANNATTYLAADIDSDDTTLSVYTGGGALFPTIVETEDYFKITIQDSLGNYEIMHVTAVDGDEFTVTRAQEGTTAKAFSAGAIVENRPTAGFLEQVANIVYASTAEAEAGTEDTKAMSPATTTDFFKYNTTEFSRSMLDDASASDALTTLGVSSFAKTLLDDTTASTALTTLGVSSFAKTLLDDDSAATARTTLDTYSQSEVDTLVSTSTAAKDLSMFNTFISQLAASRASGAVPEGWCWLFKTNELAVKTNATYDADGDYYGNSVSQTLRSLGTNSALGFVTPANVFDNNTGTYSEGPAYGVNNYITKLFGETVTLQSVTVQFAPSNIMTNGTLYYTTNNGTSWTSLSTKNFDAVDTAQSFTFSAILCNGIKLVENSGYSNNTCRIIEINPVGLRTASNMVLKNAALTLSAEPSMVALYMLHKSVDSVTLNTDLKIRASLDNGSNWSEYGTLEKVCAYDSDYDLLKADVDLSALSGTSFVYEITTFNAKSQRVRSIAALFN